MMPLSLVVNAVRNILMIAVMVFIWLLLGMVYLDRFIPPFHLLMHWLMPWKRLYSIAFVPTVEGRIYFMQELLEASNIVANLAFVALIASFALFSVYLTFVYQQRQRRIRENQMLMMKNIEIMRRNEFIRYISATIGHEFKNNLGRIKRRIALFDLPEEAKLQIDGNFDKLFADIDIFKKISDEREAGLVEFKKVNLKDMIVKLSSQYGDLADFGFEDGKISPSIFASQTLLKTVFENLIDNSIKYKKPEQKKAVIKYSCSEDADGRRRYVAISFRDEGVGMDEKQADRCFYKTKSTEEGWGQGLNFAKYVVGLHAGKIRVGREYTVPGKGTEIIIQLPFVEESLDV
jgi:signal transduction histidine kinase